MTRILGLQNWLIYQHTRLRTSSFEWKGPCRWIHSKLSSLLMYSLWYTLLVHSVHDSGLDKKPFPHSPSPDCIIFSK